MLHGLPCFEVVVVKLSRKGPEGHLTESVSHVEMGSPRLSTVTRAFWTAQSWS